MAALKRLQQGLRALTAFARPVDMALAQQYLNPAQVALFRRMQRTEQQHTIAVLRDLLAEAPVPPDLAVAALLHDVGKMHYPLAVWMKTETVLLRAFFPKLAHRWADGNPRNLLQRGLVVGRHHPDWSAELAQATGASERALWLIRHHQTPPAELQAHPDFPLMRRLQQADNAN